MVALPLPRQTTDRPWDTQETVHGPGQKTAHPELAPHELPLGVRVPDQGIVFGREFETVFAQ